MMMMMMMMMDLKVEVPLLCLINMCSCIYQVDNVSIDGQTSFHVPGYDETIPFGLLTSFAYPVEGSSKLQLLNSRKTAAQTSYLTITVVNMILPVGSHRCLVSKSFARRVVFAAW